MSQKTDFVQSTKGKHGGYALSRSPHEITLGEIIRAVEGPLSPLGTVTEIEKKIQREENHAGLFVTLLEVRNAISDILDKKTLADICEKSLEIQCSKMKSPMYFI